MGFFIFYQLAYHAISRYNLKTAGKNEESLTSVFIESIFDFLGVTSCKVGLGIVEKESDDEKINK